VYSGISSFAFPGALVEGFQNGQEHYLEEALGFGLEVRKIERLVRIS